jgi:hypothetical protein
MHFFVYAGDVHGWAQLCKHIGLNSVTTKIHSFSSLPT